MAYYVRPADPTVVAEKEREERAREEVRRNSAEHAEQTRRANEAQEVLERQQKAERERQRQLVEEEEEEARALADQIEREDRVGARARRILRERGIDDSGELTDA